MLFEHVETGLRVWVRQVDRYRTVETVHGVKDTVSAGTEIRTLCGQPVSPVVGRVDVVDVMTERGPVRVVRCR